MASALDAAGGARPREHVRRSDVSPDARRADGSRGSSDTFGTHGLCSRRVPDAARVPTTAVCSPHGVCLLRPIRTERAALSATPFASLGNLLSSHRAITRVSLAALSLHRHRRLQPTARRPGRARGHTGHAGVAPPTERRHRRRHPGADHDRIRDPDGPRIGGVCIRAPSRTARPPVWNDAHTALTVAPRRAVAHRRALSRRRRLRISHVPWIASCAPRSASPSRRVTAPAVTDFQVHLAGADLAAAKAQAAVKEVSVRSTVMAADTGARAQDAIDHPIGEGATSQSPSDTPNEGELRHVDLDRLQRADGPQRRRGAFRDQPRRSMGR